MNWPDRIVYAVAHPDEFPVPSSAEVVAAGLPTDDHILGLLAHSPRLARASLRQWARLGVHPAGEKPAARVVALDDPRARRVDQAVEHIAAVTELTVAEARAVVDRHGPDLHPTRAVRLHRRMTQE